MNRLATRSCSYLLKHSGQPGPNARTMLLRSRTRLLNTAFLDTVSIGIALGNKMQFQHLKELILDYYRPQYMHPLYPTMGTAVQKVKKFAIYPSFYPAQVRRFPYSVDTFWREMRSIEWMNLDTTDFPLDELDQSLCGISAEEYAELRTKDADFLEEVHNVPQKLPLTCLRSKLAISQ